jgi:hypothetical protein
MRATRPLRQLFRVVVESLLHPPIGCQLVFAILGGVGERAKAFCFESRNRFAIGLKMDDIARDERNHPSIDKDALAPEHAADRHGPEFAEELVDRFGVH